MTRRIPLAASLALLAGSLAACTVGADYAAPDLAVRTGDRWIGADADETTADLAEWWTRFDDPELATLVGRAFEGNLSLAEARERIIEARALRGIANAQRLPNLDAEARYTRAETGDEALTFSGPPAGREADVYSLGVVAGWEIDLWGRVARLVEAADAGIGFAVEDYRAARVALAADVAREVVRIRGVDAQLDVVRRSVALDEQTVDITRSRSAAGFVSELDLVRARRSLAADRAAIPDLLADRAAAEHRIAALLGEPAGSISVAAAPLPAPPPIPPLGLPGDLVTRRPDIRRAERDLAAETARIGAAEAERFPRVSIAGSFAFSGPDAGDMLNPDARALSIGPTISLPVFSGGRIAAQIEQAGSRARQALARLESAAVVAVQEVRTALSGRQRSDERIGSLEEAAREAADAEALARDIYGVGRTDFLAVIEAQAALLEVDRLLAQARRTRLERMIDLYTALGGGWAPAQGDDSPGAVAVAPER